MARSFHYKIEATDDRGIARTREFTVIARDEAEAREELEAVFAMHEVIESWRIAEVLAVEELAATDAFAKDYAAKGAHSYYEPL
jgi:hypothetical protein